MLDYFNTQIKPLNDELAKQLSVEVAGTYYHFDTVSEAGLFIETMGGF